MKKDKKVQSSIHVVGEDHIAPEFKNQGKIGYDLIITKPKQGKIRYKKETN